ncbi:MAG: hypothetical protein ACREH4_07000 [Vitreimonas sp.]
MTEMLRGGSRRGLAPVHGADRGGLGEKGWAEVPDDLVGGHPEVETPARVGPDGALNGPQPAMDPVTGAAKVRDSAH